MTSPAANAPTAEHERWLRAHPHADELPGWLRKTAGESRVPVLVAIIAAMALQLSLPSQYAIKPTWPLPVMEGALLVALFIANPVRLVRDHRALRIGSLLLTGAITAGNAVSAVLLVTHLIAGDHNETAKALLGGGASIYLTNIIAFGLWYWEFDRGGAFARASGRHARPDFLFPQMTSPELADRDWEPNAVDYLYVSFTNATAFSPTDTLPLSRWAKAMMAAQSMIALTTVGLVIARAVNVLQS